MRHCWTKVVEVELVSNWLRSMVLRTRHIQHAKANHPCWRLDRLCYIRNLTSCEHVASREIYKRSYTSGDLRDKGTLIADEDDNNFIVGSTGRSTWVSIRGYFTLDSELGSSTTSGSGSGSAYQQRLALDLRQPLQSGLLQVSESHLAAQYKYRWMIGSRARTLAQHWDRCSLPQMNKGVKHTEYENDLVRQNNIDHRYDYFSPPISMSTSFI